MGILYASYVGCFGVKPNKAKYARRSKWDAAYVLLDNIWRGLRDICVEQVPSKKATLCFFVFL